MTRLVAGVLVGWMLLLSGCAAPSKTVGAGGAADDFRTVINRAKEQVFPAVVFIRVVSENFEGGKKIAIEAAGSGVIISPKGEVLTNWHVVDKAVEVRCLLYDGQTLDAKVIGADKDVDLALIQLLPPTPAAGGAAATMPAKYPYAVLGDSHKLHEGDFVMAMGAPWGLSRSVSLGIISCSRRFLPTVSEYSLWLQTDASISPGNSGGPLVNTDGEVIGINTRGSTAGGDLGFAVPAETISEVLKQLRAGKVDWSWTGLQLQPIKDFNKNIYFEGSDGVIVSDTDADSPARMAGIRPRDRIMRIGGEPVAALMEEDLPVVRRRLGLLAKNQPVALEILRNGQTVTVPITPREKGKVEGESLDCPRWDLTVKTINQFANPDLYFQRNQGVFIEGVKSPGNAAASGLEGDDIIVKIDGTEVHTLDDVRRIHKASLDKAKDNPRLMITVLRNGLMRQIVLDISRDYTKE